MATAKSAAKAAKKEQLQTAASADIRVDTRDIAEDMALVFFKGLLDKAHAADGFRGVVQISLAMVQEADKFSAECERQGQPENMNRGATASYIANQWCTEMGKGFDDIVALGGGDALGDKDPREIEDLIRKHRAEKATA
jgi:hypothetical protein